MRSVYVRILLVSFAAVVLSLAAVLGIFFGVTSPAVLPMVHAFEDVLADDAVDAYTRGGVQGARAYLERLEAQVPTMKRYLVDANGRDVLTGVDRSELLRNSGHTITTADGRRILIHHSSDRRYTMVIAAPPPLGLKDFLPYFAVSLAAIAFVCWLLTMGIVSPIREMVAVVNKFGRGHLAMRARMERRDEIGELAQSFNQMADRIETLVTAERRLLQDVSHELRSPLTRLGMAIELSRTAVDRDAAADRLQREADRLSHLVADLLDVTRLEGAQEVSLNSRVQLPAIVRAVAADCELEAQSRDCHIAVEAPSDISVSGDPELLRRATENALRNAVRYAPPGTLIEVRCEEHGSGVHISVRDYGPGVPEEALARLGSPFYRVDASRDPSTGGLGLGLAIARRAVALHHGTWSVENANPGLRVVMTIPAAPIAA